MYGKLQHIPLVYFISLPAKVVPCPMYPDKVRPLRGWLKENHPRFAAVFSFAKPCGYGHGTVRQARNKKYRLPEPDVFNR